EKSLVLFGSRVDRLLSQTAIVIVHHSPANENLEFLKRYFSEYFTDTEIVVAESFSTGISKADSKTQFFVLSNSDLYLETLDIRANLLMCEQYEGATGFSHVIDLTPEQAQLLRQTGNTRGIDVSKTQPAKNVESHCRFSKRETLETQ